jgi:DNA gyrase subunit A
MSSDHIPFLAEWVRAYARENARWTEADWLRRHNIDRVERWERDRDEILARIPEEIHDRVLTLVDAGYRFSEVIEVRDAGEQDVFSVRVDTEDHSFITNGFVSHNTEAKLSNASTQWRDDTRKEIVEFVPTFDDKRTEPTVLPVTFPNLLTIGIGGIGWATACSIPTHNLAEVCDAAILVADNPDVTLKQVMKRLPGPDYPSKGVVVNPDVLEEAYRTGRGTFRLQGRWHIENLRGSTQAVVITEVPFQVSREALIKEIVESAKTGSTDPKKGITEITELPVNETDKSGTRIVVKCKRGGNAQALAAQLLKFTSLETTVKINFTVLVDQIPTTVGLLDMLRAFTDFRREVITNRLLFERGELITALDRLYALRAALDVIDRVIKIIRSADDDDDAREQLKKLIKAKVYGEKKPQPINDTQAQYILDMPLKRLNQLNQFKLDEEISGKEARIAEIDVILATPSMINDIIKDDLRAAKKNFGQPRLTSLAGATPAAAAETVEGGTAAHVGPKTDVTVFCAASGNAIAFTADSKLKAVPLNLGATDEVRAVLSTDTEAQLHVFTEKGICFRVRAAELGIDSRKGKGRPICAIDKNDRVAAVLPADSEKWLVIVTAGGEIKRIAADVLSNSYAGGVPYMGVADGDRVIAVLEHDEADEVLAHTAHGKVLRTELAKINPKKGGAAGGMALMKLSGDDRIVSASVASGDVLVVLHETGMAKAVKLDDYPVKGRGGGGVASADPAKPAKEPAGPVSLAVPAGSKDEFTLVTARGQMFTLSAAKLPLTARGPASSKPWVEIGPGDTPKLVR